MEGEQEPKKRVGDVVNDELFRSVVLARDKSNTNCSSVRQGNFHFFVPLGEHQPLPIRERLSNRKEHSGFEQIQFKSDTVQRDSIKVVGVPSER